MKWRENIGRVGRPIVFMIARALRGDSEVQSPQLPTSGPGADHPVRHPVVSVAEGSAEAAASALPPWGLLPSQIPSRVELVPGRSSQELFRRSRRISGWFFASYAVVVIAAFLVAGNPGAVALSALVVLFVAGAVLGLVGPPYVERIQEERHAGYTVWRHNTLWKPQVDAETGFVIRSAGAPMLSKKEEAAALKRVREIARYLDDR